MRSEIRMVSILAFVIALSATLSAQIEPGRRVSLGNFSLQINCIGKRSPTVVIETGFGDFGFDWMLAQKKLASHNRVCTYDRAGYGSSDLGPLPRTYAQLNLELHELLKRAGEHGPYILVGHSFGGAVVRQYAKTYADEVAGVVLVESIEEHQPISIQGQPKLIKEFAEGKKIPAPKLDGELPKGWDQSSDEPVERNATISEELQKLRERFARSEKLGRTEASQRDWSSEYYADWFAHSQQATLGEKPLVILSRNPENQDPSDMIEAQRLRAQANLLMLSSNSIQLVVRADHNIHISSPDSIVLAVRLVQDLSTQAHHF
jgi:pimeloyl-ACP methyl ester carboxylesterase